MLKNYTYTLVPESKRNTICSHYDSNGPAVNGYIIIDNGKHEPDMQGKHNAIWNAVKNHTFSQEILDVLKGPAAHAIAYPLAVADANAAHPFPDPGYTPSDRDWETV